jgi:hypothetical protein
LIAESGRAGECLSGDAEVRIPHRAQHGVADLDAVHLQLTQSEQGIVADRTVVAPVSSISASTT